MELTPHELELAVRYGLCEWCQAPRMVLSHVEGDGLHSELVCSRAPQGHSDAVSLW